MKIELEHMGSFTLFSCVRYRQGACPLFPIHLVFINVKNTKRYGITKPFEMRGVMIGFLGIR